MIRIVPAVKETHERLYDTHVRSQSLVRVYHTDVERRMLQQTEMVSFGPAYDSRK